MIELPIYIEKNGNNSVMKYLILFCLLCPRENIFIDYPEPLHPEIAEYLDSEKERFLSEYKENDRLSVTYQSFHSRYESYLFNSFYDFHGAHPISQIKTFNYLNDEYIDLDALFSEKNYFYFRDQAIRLLKPILEQRDMFVESMFWEGIEPKPENYRNVILCDRSYIIFFEHYQIAPYAAGILQIEIKSL